MKTYNPLNKITKIGSTEPWALAVVACYAAASFIKITQFQLPVGLAGGGVSSFRELIDNAAVSTFIELGRV